MVAKTTAVADKSFENIVVDAFFQILYIIVFRYKQGRGVRVEWAGGGLLKAYLFKVSVFNERQNLLGINERGSNHAEYVRPTTVEGGMRVFVEKRRCGSNEKKGDVCREEGASVILFTSTTTK